MLRRNKVISENILICDDVEKRADRDEAKTEMMKDDTSVAWLYKMNEQMK